MNYCVMMIMVVLSLLCSPLILSTASSNNITLNDFCSIKVHCSEWHVSLKCNVSSNITILRGQCISSFSQTQLVAGLCPYSYHQFAHLKSLNSTITPDGLNEAMCEPLNREGFFCRRCKPGYGIPVFSNDRDKCVKCASKLTWLLYLAVKLLPLTLFYVLVMVFSFPATHPPITAYIFYCQIFVHISLEITFIKHFFQFANPTFSTVVWTVCGLWNLDVLQWVMPSFCLSPHFNTTIHSFFLELMLVLYPVFLVVLTVVLIEMHASNFRIIVWLWKPFHKCFTSVRRSWDPKASVVNAIGSFLLLSSFKIIFTSFNMAYQTRMSNITVLYFDPTISYNSLHRQHYFIPMLLINMLFVWLPLISLLLYPTRMCRRSLRYLCSGRVRSILFLFMESFQGCYKNGTAGTYDYRPASCIAFLLRVVVGILLILPEARSAQVNNRSVTYIVYTLLATSLFYALFRPYKRQYMNVVESVLYAAAGMLLISIVHHSYKTKMFHVDVRLVLILMPSVVFFGCVMYKMLQALGAIAKIRKILDRLPWKKHVNVETEPDRLVNPSEYAPLPTKPGGDKNYSAH